MEAQTRLVNGLVEGSMGLGGCWGWVDRYTESEPPMSGEGEGGKPFYYVRFTTLVLLEANFALTTKFTLLLMLIVAL